MEASREREFEELVLLAVLIAEGDAYGISVQGILEEELGRAVSLGRTARGYLMGPGPRGVSQLGA